MDQNQPPKVDELELSLLGPGFGECVVVHLGFGKWLIVDSCFDRIAKRPVALRYLEQLGVNVAKAVELVVVTHWHDDHIQGAAEIVREATSAKFVCSAALRNQEFFVLLKAAQNEIKLVDHSSGASEFLKILDILKQRSGRQSPDQWASEGSILFEDEENAIEVRALSPSAESIAHAATTFSRSLPKAKQPIRRVVEDSPNDLSVVLLVRTHGISFLLSGDLEESGSDHRGWRAVVTSNVRSAIKSVGFKVSHHGSHNGDHPAIWTDLLEENPASLLTPYVRGRKPLPSPQDVKRMSLKTNNLFSTVWPPILKPKINDKAVKRTMEDVMKNPRAARAKPGHLRFRVQMDDPKISEVKCFDGATRISPD